MPVYHNHSTGDVITIPDVAVDYYESLGWVADEDVPKGVALDEALDEADLSKAGTADEKRTRLAQA